MLSHLLRFSRRRVRPLTSRCVAPVLEPLEDRNQPSALTYASYLGGDGSDQVNCVAVGPNGDIYVAGRTGSDNFPGTSGWTPYDNGFVAMFNPTGTTLLWATYIESSDDTGVTGIAVDSSGNAYVTGSIDFSSGFATSGAAQTSFGGNGDAFAVKLNSSGSIVYATYIGGDQLDAGNAIAVNSSGDAFVTGYTTSPNFPTKNPLTGQSALHSNSGHDAFVTEISPNGSSFLFSTYLGGSQDEPGETGATVSTGNAITVDGAGNIDLTGQTYAADFPTTTNAFQPVIGDGIDVFVTEINAATTQVVYSTFLGGSGAGNDLNIGYGIALDSGGDIYVTGSTDGVNFPLEHPFDKSVNHGDGGGNDDAFISKLDPKLSGKSELIYSTYLGGSAEDTAQAIAVDSKGDAYVTGNTLSELNFPLVHSFQKTYTGNAFIAEFSPTGTALLNSYFGGGGEIGEGIAVSPFGSVVFVGDTPSTRMPTTTNAYQATFPGSTDSGFVAMLVGKPTTEFKGVDSDGDQYTVQLTGPGAISVVQDLSGGNGEGPIQSIIVENSTSGSTLSIAVTKKVGDGFVDVGSITGSTLGKISASTFDLTGSGIDLTGSLGSLTIHDISNDADIIAADLPTQSTSIAAHVIENGTTIDTGRIISSLKAASIGVDLIEAVKLTTLAVTGDKSLDIGGNFDATLTLSGTGTVLSTASIAGSVFDASFDAVNGGIGTFTAAGFIASNIIAATGIGHVTLASVTTENGGTKFGITAGKSIASVKVTNPAFTYNSKLPTPQGEGDFEVEIT